MIQGMRRSGTTFLYDVLCADDRFDAYYEPLAPAIRKAVGGGSRIRDVDFFDKIRRVRAEFGRRRPELDLASLNCGAPRSAEAEVSAEFGQEVSDYLDFLLQRADWSLLKFVRAAAKLPALAALDPGVKVVHIVRDPRAVTTSFLFGKGQKHADLFQDPAAFFEHGNDSDGPGQLQALQLADHLIEVGTLAVKPEAPTAHKLLGLWQWHFRVTHTDGMKALGGSRYLLLRHEDVLENPEPSIDAIYALLGQEVPGAVRRWMKAHLDPTPRIFVPDDPRWRSAFEALAMGDDLVEAGYPRILEADVTEGSRP